MAPPRTVIAPKLPVSPLPSPDFAHITGAVEDAVAYPILTKDIGSSMPGGNGSGSSQTGGGQSLDAIAKNSIRQALGWRYRVDDTKGFMAALTKTFVLTEVEGHTEWNYRPQSYSVQADMGEITGAQASIYARAKNALDQTLPLIDGLTPLLPDPDYGDIEAMRSIVRDELTQLVGEFGQVAGPRVQRVESLFKLLIGAKADYRNPESVKGHLGQLGHRLGMSRRLVNTIEDEQDLTNFLIIVDYVNSLYSTWVAQRDFFSRGEHGQPFLGTQLVLISQSLASIADQVQDAYDAFDSVYLGAAERQTTLLYFFGEFAPITLAELLSWVQDFATNEGPQLLQDAGKDGVVAFRSTMNRLEYLLFLTLQLARSGGRNPARGFHTYRAQVALADVHQSLRLVDREADKIRRSAIDDDPALTSALAVFSVDSLVSVLQPTAGGNYLLTVGGKNIKPGARMTLISTKKPKEGYEGRVPSTSEVNSLGLSFSLSEGVAPNGNFITASFALPSSTDPAYATFSTNNYTVVVVNADGSYAWLEPAVSGAELIPVPVEGAAPEAAVAIPQIASVTTVKPRPGSKGVYRLKISGAGFDELAQYFIVLSGSGQTGWTAPLSPTSISSEELDIALAPPSAGGYPVASSPDVILKPGATYAVIVFNPAPAGSVPSGLPASTTTAGPVGTSGLNGFVSNTKTFTFKI